MKTSIAGVDLRVSRSSGRIGLAVIGLAGVGFAGVGLTGVGLPGVSLAGVGLRASRSSGCRSRGSSPGKKFLQDYARIFEILPDLT